MKIDQADVRDIVREFGTPVYVYNLKILRESIAEIKALSPVVRYAMKASSNAAILKEMLSQGIKIDAVSVLEAQRARRAGFQTQDVCFTRDVFFSAGPDDYFIQDTIS